MTALPGIALGFLLLVLTQNVLGEVAGAIVRLYAPEAVPLVILAGMAVYVIGGGFASQAVLSGSVGRMAGLRTSTLGRFLIGRMAGTGVLAALMIAAWPVSKFLVTWLLKAFIAVFGGQLAVQLLPLWAVLLYGLTLVLAWPLRSPAKILIGKVSRPLRRLLRSLGMGCGGSAGFAGILEEWANPWKPGKILLGASMYDGKWLVGIKDDRGHGIVAGNGAGKGRSAIIPNLLTYPGSVYVQDFKGQNAAVTAQRRREMGQAVHILEPMGEGGARLNPLAPLDPEARDYVEQIDAIVDALVIGGDDKNRFWDDSARTLIAGLIDYVVRRKGEFVPPVEEMPGEEAAEEMEQVDG